MERECQKYMKIFRPWAPSLGVIEDQDATVTTTTDNSEPEKKPLEIIEKTTKHDKLKEPVKETIPPVSSGWFGVSASEAFLLEAATLAHGLGHGVVADEYARVLLGEERRARLSAATRKQRPKKYKCPHCDVGFSNNGQLKGHIRIHTGERPFRCDVTSCGKTFTRNEELTRHKRIHSGLRPFACGECGKRFGRKDHLKKHARTHAQHRAAAAVAAVYGAVPMLPVMFPPPPMSAVNFDPWASHSAVFMPSAPPHPAPHPIYSSALYGC